LKLKVLFISIILILRKRIGLVVRLIAEAQKALTDMPLLFVLPLVTFILLGSFLSYWISTSFMIYSYGNF
jgi:solute carrier family 44 (choline transporter-like protein), member 1